MEDSVIANGAEPSPDGDVVMDEGATEPVEAPKKEVKLDELFADVDSDDEFPSSRPQDTPTSSSPDTPPSPM